MKSLVALVLFVPVQAWAQSAPVFEKDIVPLLQAKCWSCHGAQEPKNGLDLRSVATMLRGGKSGPAIAPGAPERSLLFLQIAGNKMPPGKDKLSDAEKGLIRTWLDLGAKSADTAAAVAALGEKPITARDREFWAFRTPRRPPLPASRETNPVDAFLHTALAAQGLDFSPPADRRVLIRRVYFDLLGLPPPLSEVEAFVNDQSAQAWERLIDRLLASSHYGERWGRHWLDLAGYADSEGILDADYVRAAAWRYRDYVIRSFNADKPYDRFLQEQIAGDELTGYWREHATQPRLSAPVVEGLIATGFLRCASDTSRPDFASIKNAPGYYYQTLDDTIRIVASATMGLTVHCAKCHSHKYDPIPQSEYYRLQAIFTGAYRPWQWIPQVQRKLHEATVAQEKDAAALNSKIDVKIAALTGEKADLTKQFGAMLFAAELKNLPEPIRADVQLALATEAAKRTEVQRYLATKFQAELRPTGPALVKQLAARFPDFARRNTEIEKSVADENARRPTFPEIRALYDLPGEPKTPFLVRGDYLHAGPEMQPGVLSVLSGKPLAWSAPAPAEKSSGRRLAFANWLTQPEHPLTARVLVNRVWLHHFGEGLVATPENFGRSGATPSHPELLDWLATEFRLRGWSIKTLHRVLLTSRAWQQSSRLDPQRHALALRSDPDNRLLWRQRLRRLEAEPLRDAVLAVAGTLNPQPFGPPVPMQRNGDEVVTPEGADGRRRSIYLQVRRSQPLTFLQVFDQPRIETNCTRRSNSTVAPQALTLLNSDFLVRQGEQLAERCLRESPTDPGGRAIELALCRTASATERERLHTFVADQSKRYGTEPAATKRAWADACQMLLSSSEFAYID